MLLSSVCVRGVMARAIDENSDLFSTLGDVHSLAKKLLCGVDIGGQGQSEEASNPSSQLVNVVAIVLPGCVDDLLQSSNHDW